MAVFPRCSPQRRSRVNCSVCQAGAMLILTRRPGESIIIETPAGERIGVAVAGIKGNQVRVGTEAAADVTILREELVDE